MKRNLKLISIIFIMFSMMFSILSCEPEVAEAPAVQPKAASTKGCIQVLVMPVKGAVRYVLETPSGKLEMTDAEIRAGKTFTVSLAGMESHHQIPVYCYGPNGGQLGFTRVTVFYNYFDNPEKIIAVVDPNYEMKPVNIGLNCRSDRPGSSFMSGYVEIRYKSTDRTPLYVYNLMVADKDAPNDTINNIRLKPGEYYMTIWGCDSYTHKRLTKSISMNIGVTNVSSPIKINLEYVPDGDTGTDVPSKGTAYYFVNAPADIDSITLEATEIGYPNDTYEAILDGQMGHFENLKVDEAYDIIAKCYRDGNLICSGLISIRHEVLEEDRIFQINCPAYEGELPIRCNIWGSDHMFLKTWPVDGGEAVSRDISHSQIASIPVPSTGDHYLKAIGYDEDGTELGTGLQIYCQGDSKPVTVNFFHYSSSVTPTFNLKGITEGAEEYEVIISTFRDAEVFRKISNTPEISFSKDQHVPGGYRYVKAYARKSNGEIVSEFKKTEIYVNNQPIDITLTSPLSDITADFTIDPYIQENEQNMSVYFDGEYSQYVNSDTLKSLTFTEISPGSHTIEVISYGINHRVIGHSIHNIHVDGTKDIHVEMDLKPIACTLDLAFVSLYPVDHLMVSVDGGVEQRYAPTDIVTITRPDAGECTITVKECDADGTVVKTQVKTVSLQHGITEKIEMPIGTKPEVVIPPVHRFQIELPYKVYGIAKIDVSYADSNGKTYRDVIDPNDTIELTEGIWSFDFSLCRFDGRLVGKGHTDGFEVSSSTVGKIPISSYTNEIYNGRVEVYPDGDWILGNKFDISLIEQPSGKVLRTASVRDLDYCFDDVPPGTYVVKIVDSGWESTEWTSSEFVLESDGYNSVAYPCCYQKMISYTFTVEDTSAARYELTYWYDNDSQKHQLPLEKGVPYEHYIEVPCSSWHMYLIGYDGHNNVVMALPVSTIAITPGKHDIKLSVGEGFERCVKASHSPGCSFQRYDFYRYDSIVWTYIVPAGTELRPHMITEGIYYMVVRNLDLNGNILHVFPENSIEFSSTKDGTVYSSNSLNPDTVSATVELRKPAGYGGSDYSIKLRYKESGTIMSWHESTSSETRLYPGKYDFECILLEGITEILKTPVFQAELFEDRWLVLDDVWDTLTYKVPIIIDKAYGDECYLYAYDYDNPETPKFHAIFDSGDSVVLDIPAGHYRFELIERNSSSQQVASATAEGFIDKNTDAISFTSVPEPGIVTFDIVNDDQVSYWKISGKPMNGSVRDFGVYPIGDDIYLEKLETGYWIFDFYGYESNSSEPTHCMKKGVSVMPLENTRYVVEAEDLMVNTFIYLMPNNQNWNLHNNYIDNISLQIDFDRPEYIYDVSLKHNVIPIRVKPGLHEVKVKMFSPGDSDSRTVEADFQKGMTPLSIPYSLTTWSDVDIRIELGKDIPSGTGTVELEFDNRDKGAYGHSMTVNIVNGIAEDEVSLCPGVYDVYIKAEGIDFNVHKVLKIEPEHRYSLNTVIGGIGTITIEDNVCKPPKVSLSASLNGIYTLTDTMTFNANVVMAPDYGNVEGKWYVDTNPEASGTGTELVLAAGLLPVGKHVISYELADGKQLYHVTNIIIDVR